MCRADLFPRVLGCFGLGAYFAPFDGYSMTASFLAAFSAVSAGAMVSSYEYHSRGMSRLTFPWSMSAKITTRGSLVLI